MRNGVIERVPRIGVVAGTAEGAALCCRILCQEAEDVMGRYMHPEITLHSFPLRHYLEAVDQLARAALASATSPQQQDMTQGHTALVSDHIPHALGGQS